MIDAGEHEVVGKLLNDLRTPCLAVSSRWNGLWNCTGAPSGFLPLAPTRWRPGRFALVAITNGKRAKKDLRTTPRREPESDSAKAEAQWRCSAKMGLLAPGPAERNFRGRNLRAEIPNLPLPKLPFEEEESRSRNSSQARQFTSSETCGLTMRRKDSLRSRSPTWTSSPKATAFTQKAIGLREAILRRQPRHTRQLGKTGRLCPAPATTRRTAELAAKLEQVTVKRAR